MNGMGLKERIEMLQPDTLKAVRRDLGDEAADKANAIIAILQIGDQRNVAYSKAILAATEMVLEMCSSFIKEDC